MFPVILCGGSGTRLWPRSRAVKPKPFLPLVGDTTLFEATLGR
ncbi:sugar phosphate nucleotidyltransferase, partial [Pseudomonas sp.]